MTDDAPAKTPARRTPAAADLHAMILGALEDAGGRDYLAAQAARTPSAFLTLLGKILPSQARPQAAPIKVEIVRFSDADDPAS